jgi:hypothetical protein
MSMSASDKYRPGDQGLVIDQLVRGEAFDQVLAVDIVALRNVIAVFGYVDMQAPARGLHDMLQQFHARARDRERRVCADHGLHQIGLVTLGLGGVDLPGKRQVLVDAGFQLCIPAIAVRGFVAGDAAKPGFDEASAQGAQRPGHAVRRRVMINHRRAAALDGFERTDEPAVVQRLFVQCLIRRHHRFFSVEMKSGHGLMVAMMPRAKPE